MRALVFKIYVDKLVTKDWSHWKRADQEHIKEVANQNGVLLAWELDGFDTVTFKGSPEELFNFMYDVAYRYDIEII